MTSARDSGVIEAPFPSQTSDLVAAGLGVVVTAAFVLWLIWCGVRDLRAGERSGRYVLAFALFSFLLLGSLIDKDLVEPAQVDQLEEGLAKERIELFGDDHPDHDGGRYPGTHRGRPALVTIERDGSTYRWSVEYGLADRTE
ncbi:hypothetical protein [Aeromicrobium flavum]|nr:hypothetical protein [Aeromicrobium flavum]